MQYSKQDVDTVEHHMALGDWLPTYASRIHIIAQKAADPSRHRQEVVDDLMKSVATMQYTYEHYELMPKKPS